MKKLVEFVVLPTEKSKGALEKCISLPYKNYGVIGSLALPHPMKEDLHWESQHLYITVSQDIEPIKEGDWVIETQEGLLPIAVQITNIEYELATDIMTLTLMY